MQLKIWERSLANSPNSKGDLLNYTSLNQIPEASLQNNQRTQLHPTYPSLSGRSIAS